MNTVTIRAIHPVTVHLDGGLTPDARIPGELRLALARGATAITAYRVELSDGTLLSVSESRRLYFTSSNAKQAIQFAQR